MNQRYPQSRHTPHRGSEKPTQGKVPAFLRGIERALLRRAPDVPCGRLVFSRPQLRRTGARTVRKGGRRPPASVASSTGLPSGACEAGSGGGRARTPSVARLGAASRAITQLGGGFTETGASPDGFTNSAK